MKFIEKKGLRLFSICRQAFSFAAFASILTVSTQAAVVRMSVQQPVGSDWDTAASWSNGLGATETAATNPATTFELLPGSLMRTPADSNIVTFPGNALYVDGSGVFVNDPPPGASVSEIRFMQLDDAHVAFPHLIMNGGQLDAGSDGTVHVEGLIEIAANTPIYNDSANDRGLVIDGVLSGTNNIEYHGYNKASFDNAYSHNLNIAHNDNPFSGKWNVIVGTLLGTGTNALGTNDITIGPEGALETTYDINNAKGTLILQGRIFLHQNDTFRTVVVGMTPLTNGVYTFEQLNAAFPDHFPAAWTAQVGAEAFGEGFGSITVLQTNTTLVVVVVPPTNARVLLGQTATFTAQITGPATSIQWYRNGVAITGANDLSFTTDPVTAADNNSSYKVVIANNVNSVEATANLSIGQEVVTKGFLKDEIWIGAQYDKDSIQTTTDTPARVRYLTSFESLSNQADNYAEKVSGWITPTVSGDYVFFIAADEDSYLYLSPDADPNHKLLIATEPEYNAPRAWLATTRRTEGAPENRSDAFTGTTIHLEAGQSYYIEADHHDTTGNDNLAVTFKLAASPDPLDGTAPALAGMMLSATAVDGTTLDITTQPVSQTASAGAQATFSVMVNSSTTNVVYQWQKNVSGVWTDVAGANSASFVTPPLSAADAGDYRVLVSAPGATLQTSATAHLTVGGGVTPNAVTIKNVTYSGGAIHFSFPTQVGVNYTIEYKAALSDANWTMLNDFTLTGTGADVTADDNVAGGTRFYRVTAR